MIDDYVAKHVNVNKGYWIDFPMKFLPQFL